MTSYEDALKLQGVSGPGKDSIGTSMGKTPYNTSNVVGMGDFAKSVGSGLLDFVDPRQVAKKTFTGQEGGLPAPKNDLESYFLPAYMADNMKSIAPLAGEVAPWVVPGMTGIESVLGKGVLGNLGASALKYGTGSALYGATGPNANIGSTALSGVLGTILGPAFEKVFGPEAGVKTEASIIQPKTSSGTESLGRATDIINTANKSTGGAIDPYTIQPRISQRMSQLKDWISNVLDSTGGKFSLNTKSTGDNSLYDTAQKTVSDTIAGFYTEGAGYKKSFDALMSEIRNKFGGEVDASTLHDVLSYVGNKKGIWGQNLNVDQEIARTVYGGVRNMISKMSPNISEALNEESQLLSYNAGIEKLAGGGSGGRSVGALGIENPLMWLSRLIGDPIIKARLGIAKLEETGIPALTGINKTVQGFVK